jgi:hypothetical protein
MAPGLLHPDGDSEFSKILNDAGDRLVVVDFFAVWWLVSSVLVEREGLGRPGSLMKLG